MKYKKWSLAVDDASAPHLESWMKSKGASAEILNHYIKKREYEVFDYPERSYYSKEFIKGFHGSNFQNQTQGYTLLTLEEFIEHVASEFVTPIPSPLIFN